MGKMSAVGLQSIHEKFPNLEVVILSCFDKDIDRLKLFAKSNAITIPIVTDCESIKKDYNIAVYPVYYIIDENGKVLYTRTGYNNKVTEKQLEDAVTNHLLLKE